MEMDWLLINWLRIQKFAFSHQIEILSSQLRRGTYVSSTYYNELADCEWYLIIDSYGDHVEINLRRQDDKEGLQSINVRDDCGFFHIELDS